MILFYCCKVNTNLTAFMKFVQHKILRESKVNLLNVSCHQIWFLFPPKKLIPVKKISPSCQQMSHFMLERKNATCKKIYPNSHQLEGSRRKRNLFQIISIKFQGGWWGSEFSMQRAQGACREHAEMQGIGSLWVLELKEHSVNILPLGQPWDFT